jgi:branched-chain amino acid transport system ATP-binding protein
MSEILAMDNVSAGYGKQQVLDNVSLGVQERTITALVGHNGAGKSTLLHTVFGTVPWARGTLLYRGRDISQEPPTKRLEHGIVLVPQGVNVFGELTVQEHLRLVGAKGERDFGVVFDLFPSLRDKTSRLAQGLSGGERQMLAIACAVVRRPNLMLVDEPSTGLAPILVGRVMENLKRMRDSFDLTVLVVEQNVAAVLDVCDFLYAMRAGAVIFSDDAAGARRMEAKELWKLL